MKPNFSIKWIRILAGGPGFEPELPGPEPGVLPLNYPPRECLGLPHFSEFGKTNQSICQ